MPENDIGLSKLREFFEKNPMLALSYITPSDNTRVVTDRVDEKVREALENSTKKKLLELSDKRLKYRLRKAAENLIAIPMSDDAVDDAIAAEERSEPRFELGSTRPSIDTDRLANQYANTQSFYSALGSPYIMPMTYTLIRRNPEVAATQLSFGLNNPALTTLLIAAPTGPSAGVASAAGSAFRAGMSTARPMLTRLATSTGRAITAGGRLIAQNAPRVAATTTVNTVPLIGFAAPTAGDGSSNNFIPGLITGVIGSGILGAIGYKVIKNRRAKKAGDTTTAETTKAQGSTTGTTTTDSFIYSPNKKVFTWERPFNWENVAREQAEKDFKASIKREWNNAVTSGTTKSFKDKYGLSYKDGRKKVYFSDKDIAAAIQNDAFDGSLKASGVPIVFENIPNFNSYIYTGPTTGQSRWAYARNAGRVGALLGIPIGGYFLYSDSPNEVESEELSTTNGEQTTETIVRVPWGDPAPTTTSDQEVLDSIMGLWRDQINN